MYSAEHCIDAKGEAVFWKTHPPTQCNFEGFTVLFHGTGTGEVTSGAPAVHFGNSTDGVQFVRLPDYQN